MTDDKKVSAAGTEPAGDVFRSIPGESKRERKHNIKQIRDALDIVSNGKPATRYTENQREKVLAAAAIVTGTDPADIDSAAEVVRGVLASASLEDLNEALQQEGLKPLRAAADPQPGKTSTDAEKPENGQKNGRNDTQSPDPALDPTSPDFDIEKWSQTTVENLDKAQQSLLRLQDPELPEVSKVFNEAMESITSITKAFYNPVFDAMREAYDTLLLLKDSAVKPVSDQLSAYFNSFQWERVSSQIKQIITVMPAWLELSEVLDDLAPYLRVELQKPEYENKSLEELLETAETDENGNLLEDSLFVKALRAAQFTKKIAKQYPLIQSAGTPKYFTSPNTTLSNALQANDGKGEIIGKGAIDLPVLSIGTKNETTIYVNATLENMDGVEIKGKKLTEYDRVVHDAVATLFIDRTEHGQVPLVTPDMIYRTMTHKTATEKVSAQQREEVIKSVEKLRRNIHISADASDEMQRRNITIEGRPVTQYVIDDFMLSATRMTVRAGGELVKAYLLHEPVLLKYAKLTGQLLTVNGKMLDIKQVDRNGKITTVALSNNENRIATKSYLLRRVEIMRHDELKAKDALKKYKYRRAKHKEMPEKHISDFRKQQRTILFESLFQATGITAPNSKTKIKDYVFCVLDYWKADGRIKSYKIRKKGGAPDAVVIEVL